jgi:lysophospholipase L1-like esterase
MKQYQAGINRRNFLKITSISPFVFGANTQTENQPSEIINSGVGGNNTVDLLARIEDDCLKHKPNLTILMVGTNDMNSRKYIPILEFEQNMRKIIRMILNKNSKILLMNILPVYEPYLMTRHNPEFYQPEGHTRRKAQMNELIKNLALEYKLYFLDVHHLFEKVGNVGVDASSLIKNEVNSQTKDGVHPTPDGYRLIGTSVYQEIVHQKLPTKKIVCFGDSITIGDGIPNGANYPAYLNKLINS